VVHNVQTIKIVLTGIAAALVLLTCQNFFEIKSATAITQSGKVTGVAVCNLLSCKLETKDSDKKSRSNRRDFF
jgi:hypothetical protein